MMPFMSSTGSKQEVGTTLSIYGDTPWARGKHLTIGTEQLLNI